MSAALKIGSGAVVIGDVIERMDSFSAKIRFSNVGMPPVILGLGDADGGVEVVVG